MRFALRQLLKSPGFTAVVVLSLALGIGANTALFSLIDDVLLRSLAVPNPSELALLRWSGGPNAPVRSHVGMAVTDPTSGLRSSTSVSYFVYDRLREQNQSFIELFAFGQWDQLNVGVERQAELTVGQVVTGNYFAGLGVTAFRGRLLTEADDRLDAPSTVVISHRYWQRRFAGADTAIGSNVTINNLPATIVGVLPPTFTGTLEAGSIPDVTLPMVMDTRLSGRPSGPGRWWMQVMGRLKPGVALTQAQAQLEPTFIQAAFDSWTISAPAAGSTSALAERTAPHLQFDPGGQGLVEMRRQNARPLRVLLAIVVTVLVIACVNVANLLLARSAARQKEIAVRFSLGASRAQVIRQLLAESLLLSLLGGIVGVFFAVWGRDALLHLNPYGASGSLPLNLRVLGFTCGVSLLTGLAFGLVPAWQATRVDLNTAMKNGPVGLSGFLRFRARRVLMVAQIALSVVLLVGAGLFLQTLVGLRNVELGFKRDNLLLFRLDAGLSGYRGVDVTRLFDRLHPALEAIPGVEAVTYSRHGLVSGSRRKDSVSFPASRGPAREGLEAAVNVVAPSFFHAMGISLLRGRDMNAGDRTGAPLVAIVNETFVRNYLSADPPLGETFRLGGALQAMSSYQIIGVVQDARYAALRGPVPPTVYLSTNQEPVSQVNFAVRSPRDAQTLAAEIRQVVHGVDTNLPVYDLRTQDAQIDTSLAQERLFAALSTLFSGLALALTCMGLYGLLAQQVTLRTREIGIRMALGAQLQSVLRLIMGEGLRLAAIGSVLGLGLALALSRFVALFLFGVPPTYPLAMAAAPALLLLVAALACLLPARRAARIDPMIALRSE